MAKAAIKTPTLDEIMLGTGTDKNTAGHGYSIIYDETLKHLRHTPARLLELGIWEGASLRAWAEYFNHPAAAIIGADNDIGRFVPMDDERVQAHHVQLSNINEVAEFAKRLGGPVDVIIDDASHGAYQQHLCYHALWPSLKPGGLYIIEDLHTYFWPRSNPANARDWLGDLMAGVLGFGAEPKANDYPVARMAIHPSMVIMQKRV